MEVQILKYFQTHSNAHAVCVCVCDLTRLSGIAFNMYYGISYIRSVYFHNAITGKHILHGSYSIVIVNIQVDRY